MLTTTSDMPTRVSEECGSLLGDQDSLYIEGIGAIAQYHNWLDVQWEKGLPYFVRDVKAQQLEQLAAKQRQLQKQIELLNSEIIVHESCR